MNPYETLVQIEYLSLGIIPPNVPINESLKKMSPGESRKARRKFRKLHRKAKKEYERSVRERLSRRGFIGDKETIRPKMVKRQLREKMCDEGLIDIQKMFGAAGEDPTVRQRIERHRAVNISIQMKVDY